jgi:hypothetical protein
MRNIPAVGPDRRGRQDRRVLSVAWLLSDALDVGEQDVAFVVNLATPEQRIGEVLATGVPQPGRRP